MAPSAPVSTCKKAWVITGPTSGIGYQTALELAKHGTVVLVGRSKRKLDAVEGEIRSHGGQAVSVIADLSDVTSARRAAREIAALDLLIAGMVNNAGIMPVKPFTTAQGWDGTFATDHLGPFALTEALIPALPDGANVVFICSAVEDPERHPAHMVGFRGARYISAEASVRGEWLAGGSKIAGADAYATSKQGNLATVLGFSREFPRLRFNAVEPGVTPGSNLSRDTPAAAQVVGKVMSVFAPFLKYFSTPKRSARVITKVLTDSETTGVYYDENGRPMRGSKQVHDPAFQDRYIAEARALLASIPAEA